MLGVIGHRMTHDFRGLICLLKSKILGVIAGYCSDGYPTLIMATTNFWPGTLVESIWGLLLSFCLTISNQLHVTAKGVGSGLFTVHSCYCLYILLLALHYWRFSSFLDIVVLNVTMTSIPVLLWPTSAVRSFLNIAHVS
ncbi:hypothetical protein V1523DRAFT_422141 [Lipomyces doorenjongii]